MKKLFLIHFFAFLIVVSAQMQAIPTWADTLAYVKGLFSKENKPVTNSNVLPQQNRQPTEEEVAISQECWRLMRNHIIPTFFKRTGMSEGTRPHIAIAYRNYYEFDNDNGADITTEEQSNLDIKLGNRFKDHSKDIKTYILGHELGHYIDKYLDQQEKEKKLSGDQMLIYKYLKKDPTLKDLSESELKQSPHKLSQRLKQDEYNADIISCLIIRPDQYYGIDKKRVPSKYEELCKKLRNIKAGICFFQTLADKHYNQLPSWFKGLSLLFCGTKESYQRQLAERLQNRNGTHPTPHQRIQNLKALRSRLLGEAPEDLQRKVERKGLLNDTTTASLAAQYVPFAIGTATVAAAATATGLYFMR